MKPFLYLLMIAALVSCSKRSASPTANPAAPDPYSGYAHIAVGIDANPTNDFARAIATNDTRFVAYKFRIQGHPWPALAYPAAQAGDIDKYGVKVIAGTGVAGSNAFPTEVALRYATDYNGLLLQHLKATPGK